MGILYGICSIMILVHWTESVPAPDPLETININILEPKIGGVQHSVAENGRRTHTGPHPHPWWQQDPAVVYPEYVDPEPEVSKIPHEPPYGQRCSGRNFGERRCCSPENPCDEGEGDCDGVGDGGQNDGNTGCKGSLVCGSNNCKQFGTYYHEKDDCCEKKSVSGSSCKDKDAKCVEYKGQGFCTKQYSKWMSEHCKKTCNKCPGRTTSSKTSEINPNHESFPRFFDWISSILNILGGFGGGRPVIGRPFMVHGKSRTASSKTSDSSSGSNPNPESWKTGPSPSVSPQSPHSNEIGLYWLHQAEAEHASVASFARHTLQLMSLGAPARLLVASQQASLDEIKHARICYGFASAFLGEDLGPGLLDVDESLDNMDLKEIIRSVITEGCIGETLSAVEAHLAAHYAQDLAVKDALTQIAAEETNHGQLAWDTIKWIIEKHPETRSYVDGIFHAELEHRMMMSARNGTSLPSTKLCQDYEKETSFRRYGLIDGADRGRVREAGIREIIAPIYRAGFKDVDNISKLIKQLEVALL